LVGGGGFYSRRDITYRAALRAGKPATCLNNRPYILAQEKRLREKEKLRLLHKEEKGGKDFLELRVDDGKNRQVNQKEGKHKSRGSQQSKLYHKE